MMWLSRMRGRCLWRFWWRKRFRGSRRRSQSLCGFVMRLLLQRHGLSRLRRMLIPRLLARRMLWWRRSRLTGWRRSRRRRMLRVARRRRRVVRRMLLRLRLSLVLRRRWRVSVPTMLVWLGMPRLGPLLLPLVARRMRRRRRLMLRGRPLRRRRLPRMLPGRRLRLPVAPRMLRGLRRRLMATRAALRRLPTSSASPRPHRPVLPERTQPSP